MAHLQVSAILPSPRTHVFDLLTSPERLGELLVKRIDVQLVRGADSLRRGAEYEFLMTRCGFCQSVRIRVEDLLKSSRVSYRQTEGLFESWVHTMKFEDHGDNQTLVTDYVDYRLPFGLLGFVADDLFVRRDMRLLLSRRLARAKSLLMPANEEGAAGAT